MSTSVLLNKIIEKEADLKNSTDECPLVMSNDLLHGLPELSPLLSHPYTSCLFK